MITVKKIKNKSQIIKIDGKRTLKKLKIKNLKR